MSEVKTTINSFVKEFKARLSGDDNEVLAQKTLRSANSALDVQISNMTGDLIGLEDSLEATEDNLVAARVNNGKAITDRSVYVSALINAEQKRLDAKENLESHIETLEFLKEQKTLINKEINK
jgi:hypothetical protein